MIVAVTSMGRKVGDCAKICAATPGAKRSTQVPKFEYDARLSALVDLFDLNLLAYNLSQRLDRLITGVISVDDASQSFARTLVALESVPNLSPETPQYLLSLKQKFITTSIVGRRTPRK